MPRVSRIPVNKSIKEELEEYFVSLISSLNNSNEIKQFFQDFLTKEEKLMLAKRLMLHLMLENGYKPFQVQQVLSISRETVRTHSNVWARGGSVYKKIIKKIAKKETAKRFWERVEKILKPIDLALRAKTDMKARAKLVTLPYD